MAEKDIVQNMISQLGQSQGERMPEALRTDFVEIDERTTDDLLRFAKKLAPLVNYYRNDIIEPKGSWAKFFSYNDDAAALLSLRQGREANTAPHLALFLAFLELYREPQALINRFTGRHLDFYYRDVLRLKKKPPIPDRAHVLVELKKQSLPIIISRENVFSAGKDKSGPELIYAPTDETVVNVAKVDSLRSIFLETSDHGAVHYAPIANSSDGVGGALPETDAKWHGFGHANLPFAEVGFALASPVLRMKEGLRRVRVKLTLANVDATKLNATALASAFDVFVTGEKNWQGPYTVSAALNGGEAQLDFTVPETEKAVIDYDAAIHGYAYAAKAPVVQLLLKADRAGVGYNDFKNVTVQKIQVSVDVSNVTSLHVESDGGVLDPKKAFLPFGPEPAKGSRFLVGYDEAFPKKLSEAAIKIQWKDAPSDFAARYRQYGILGGRPFDLATRVQGIPAPAEFAMPNEPFGISRVDNGYFTATVSFKEDSGSENVRYGVPLFNSSDPASERTITLKLGGSAGSPGISSGGMSVNALRASRSRWAAIAANALVLKSPVLSSFKTSAPQSAGGFITLSLEKDFLHSTYRQKYVGYVVAQDAGSLALLKEPYTPAIESISLSYKADSDEVNVASVKLEDFANLDAQFFHVAYFGQMHEHGYQRNQFSFLADKSVSLLPVYENEGELLVGLSNLNPRDSVSVLFQVAEGSADPELTQEKIVWSALCDNYWKPLGSEGVVLDTTNQLLTSGIIKFVIPAEATTQNTILPSNRIWLRAGVARNVTAVGQLIAVAANAVEVQFRDQGNDPRHLMSALEAGSITKLKNGLAAVKTVKQPYASFGGVSEEIDNDFYRRVSERLRHKDRCITPWDYERIILEAFPRVHKVKCIPHAREGGWLAPGCVLIVVVPDLKNKIAVGLGLENTNTMDPLQPKVDADTISRIAEFVRRRTGMQVQVKVKNPSYQRIQLDFKVKFRTGYEFNRYREELNRQLIGFLSPWAFASGRSISFGGKVYKSVLLDFVEELPPIDYVTDFKMYNYLEGAAKIDVNEAHPETPDAILVSDYTHVVNEAD